MSRLVLDASITASWLLGDELDPRAVAALDLLRHAGAFVPQLWQYEVRNVLLVAERRDRLLKEQTEERLDSLKGLPIFIDREPDLHVALDMAREHDLSFYDALYLELAKRRRAALATLDAKLARAALTEGLQVPLS